MDLWQSPRASPSTRLTSDTCPQFCATGRFCRNAYFHFIPFSTVLLHRKSSSLYSMSHQWMTIITIHHSVRLAMTSMLHRKSNLNIELALDLRKNRNLWYMWLGMLKPLSLALKIGAQRVWFFLLEKLVACICCCCFLFAPNSKYLFRCTIFQAWCQERKNI